MTVTLHTGDCREVLAKMPPKSVHSVITSPPYFNLRDYGTKGQIGLEKSVDAYVKSLVGVFRKVWRVLRDDGTLWLNLGDSFSHGGCGARDKERWPKQSRNDHMAGVRHRKKSAATKPKDMLMVPARLVIAMQAAGWYNRGDVIWQKPNPMTESVKDRPTRSHEYLYLLTKRPEYFYDWLAICEPAVTEVREPSTRSQPGKNEDSGLSRYSGFNDRWWREGGRQLRNKRSVWTIATQPLAKIPHFATFPEALVEPCLLAGTSPMGVCAKCGAPLEREVDTTRLLDGEPTDLGAFRTTSKGAPYPAPNGVGHRRISTDRWTTGWHPTCPVPGHVPPRMPGVVKDGFEGLVRPALEPATVLDPFMGTGTVGVVALKHGRSFIGIELNPASTKSAEERMRGITSPMFADAAESLSR